MKSKIVGTLIMLLIFVLSGCSTQEEQLPDTYVEGSDYQYMYAGNGSFPIFQKGEAGYYLLWDNFIYFFDDEEEKIIPLCSRPDCLHDKETDQEKREACNAYASTFGDTGLSYCNGNIYYINEDISTTPALYQFAADGSGKEMLYEWDEAGVMPEQWIVHRDVLYYTIESYYTDEDDIEEFLALYALPLTGRDRLKPKQIYVPEEEGVEVVTLGNPVAYGNYVYFTVVGNRDGWDEPGVNEAEYVYTKTFVYDIQEEEVREITVPGQTAVQVVGGVGFWQDQIIFSLFDHEKNYSGEGVYYVADLDGSDPEVLFTTERQIYNVFSDGKYLYRSNANAEFYGWVEDAGPKLYHVYDEELNEIDTFTTDDVHNYDFPIGNPDKAYNIYYKDSGEWGIECWDKSAIGSLNGAEIEFTDIPYEGSIQD